MKFNPMSEQEANSGLCLPTGEYDFEIIKAEETNSKSSGLGMFALELRVIGDDGVERRVRDYVMTEGKAAYRLRQCAVGCMLLEQYNAGELTGFDFEGRTGRVRLGIEKSEQYGDRNRVMSYVQPGREASADRPRTPSRVRERVPAADLDDEIPF